MRVLLVLTGRLGAEISSGSKFYIDGRRTEGDKWQWATSKKKIKNFHWLNGQPNNELGVQDCIAMSLVDRGLTSINWDDWHCESKLRAVCQYP